MRRCLLALAALCAITGTAHGTIAQLELENRWTRLQRFLGGIETSKFRMAPGARLDYVLISDAEGDGTWQTPDSIAFTMPPVGVLSNFWYKPGVAGGVTAYGGTAAGEDIVLRATTHAGGGTVQIMPRLAQADDVFEILDTSANDLFSMTSLGGISTTLLNTATVPLLVRFGSTNLYRFGSSLDPGLNIRTRTDSLQSVLNVSSNPSGSGSYIRVNSGNQAGSATSPTLIFSPSTGLLSYITTNLNKGLRFGHVSGVPVTTYTMDVDVSGIGRVDVNPVGSADTASVPLTVYASASQTRNIQNWSTFGAAATPVSVGPGGQFTVRSTSGIPLSVQRATSGSSNIVQVYDASGNTRFAINAGGRTLANTTSNVGWVNAGVTNTSGSIDLTQVALSTIFTQSAIAGQQNTGGLWRLTPTLTGDAVDGIFDTNLLRIAPTLSNYNGIITGIESALALGDEDASFTGNDHARALNFTVTTAGTAGSYSSITGAIGSILHQSALPVTGTMQALNASAILSNGSGLVSDLTMCNLFGNINTGSQVTDATGLHIDVGGQGTSNTVRGVEIFDISSAATDSCWALYFQTNKQSWLNGSLGVGGASVVVPTAKIHVAAGGTAARSAPLKFTSGTSMTSAEAGAFEYTTDDLFFTIATGTARKRLLMADPTGGLTSGRVPYATTNGRLTDDADLSFDGTDKLTATKLAITQGDIVSGVYTPTRSAEVNMDANVTTTQAQYMRVGDVVTVSGRFTADPTTTILTTSFEMTLPIASNIGAVEDLAGTATCGNIASMSGELVGSVANNTVVVQWKATDVTSQVWSYTFVYRIL